MDTFVEAPDVATLVEDDFELLEHALKTREAVTPVTTRPIAGLHIACPAFQSPMVWTAFRSSGAAGAGIYGCRIKADIQNAQGDKDEIRRHRRLGDPERRLPPS